MWNSFHSVTYLDILPPMLFTAKLERLLPSADLQSALVFTEENGFVTRRGSCRFYVSSSLLYMHHIMCLVDLDSFNVMFIATSPFLHPSIHHPACAAAG